MKQGKISLLVYCRYAISQYIFSVSYVHKNQGWISHSLLENRQLAIYNSTTEINLLRRFQYFFCFLRIINCTSSHQTFLFLSSAVIILLKDPIFYLLFTITKQISSVKQKIFYLQLVGDARFENGEPPAVPRFQKVRSSKTSAQTVHPTGQTGAQFAHIAAKTK